MTDPNNPAADSPPSGDQSTLELPHGQGPVARPPVPPSTEQPEKPVAAVSQSAAVEVVKLDDGQARRLDELVRDYVDSVTALDTNDRAFAARANDIANLGSEDIRASSRVSNRLLEKPLAAAKGGQNSKVTRSLLELRRTIERLDPQRQGNLQGRKLLGVIPMGDPMVDYFRKYQSSQSHINEVIVSLYDGQEELRRDNVDIDQEKQNLWESMSRLRQYGYMAEQLDATLSTKIAEIEATDPERARVLKNDLLFPVRQKREDLLTQLAVSVQGYLALDLIKRNNVELVRGVDRATTTTVSALRTAVIVAQALANQKLVLDQIAALNETTGSLIESTSEMLKEQSGQVSRQAYEATVGIDKLQAAFSNVYATMDEIDTFKVKALDTMAQTIETLEREVEKSRSYVDRARAREAIPVGQGETAPAPELVAER
jgi:uncharacterized protein YaaN involved in tellurite resistance